jgi:hypothetical protein
MLKSAGGFLLDKNPGSPARFAQGIARFTFKLCKSVSNNDSFVLHEAIQH